MHHYTLKLFRWCLRAGVSDICSPILQCYTKGKTRGNVPQCIWLHPVGNSERTSEIEIQTTAGIQIHVGRKFAAIFLFPYQYSHQSRYSQGLDECMAGVRGESVEITKQICYRSLAQQYGLEAHILIEEYFYSVRKGKTPYSEIGLAALE